jgi:transposase
MGGLRPANDQLQKDIDGYFRKRHPKTQEIEKALIAGDAVPAILEKIEVSAPTVYVIKNRLRKEGKLPQA